MFGFQPTPPAGSPWRLANWIFPPPPPPPCSEVPCGTYNLSWGTIPTIDIVYRGDNSSYQGISLRPYIIGVDTIVCLNYYIFAGSPPPGIIFDHNAGVFWGKPYCGTPGEYTVTVGVSTSLCGINEAVTTDITFNYYCPVASWVSDPITINATTGLTEYYLSSYVQLGTLFCNQNYYYDGDDGGNLGSAGPFVSVNFGSPGTYYGSATVDNNCQNVSSNTVGIIYYIT